ncbi:MAG: hypothetical protein HXN28_08175 [Prevotella histicola]|nr:hypothetical protein [Prevotella histicola]
MRHKQRSPALSWAFYYPNNALTIIVTATVRPTEISHAINHANTKNMTSPDTVLTKLLSRRPVIL